MSDRICLVEDNPTIRELVAARMQSEGFSIASYDTAEGVAGDEGAWDLVIVDILLAGRMTGLDLCALLRERSPALPILILSALSEPSDRVEGLKRGADDYLTKPFEMEELLLRVRGMLKRRSWYAKLPELGSVFAWDENEIDFSKFLGRRRRETFALTQKECMLMKLLVEREGEIVSRDEILDSVWGYDIYPSSRTVDNFVLRLRKHFEAVPSEPKYIHSVRGMGYKFTR